MRSSAGPVSAASRSSKRGEGRTPAGTQKLQHRQGGESERQRAGIREESALLLTNITSEALALRKAWVRLTWKECSQHPLQVHALGESATLWLANEG